MLTAIHVCRQLKLCQHALVIDKIGDQVLYSEVPLERDENTDTVVEVYSPTSSNIYKPIHSIMDQLSLMPDQTELCISGAALIALCEEKNFNFVDWIVHRTRIFARTKPDQKTWIIQRLISQGRCVGMCGDGTNDCGALKAAHVGLALSDAEASIVAPFTSARKMVSDIVTLVKEGRCALETSFVSFKVLSRNLVYDTLPDYTTADVQYA
jgi:cation-transporting P-type ATPase 13A2